MRHLLDFDIAWLHALNGLAGRSSVLDALMIGCARFAPAAFAVLLLALWLSWRPRLQRGAALAGIAALVALGIGQLLGMALPRLRPYEAAGLHVRLLVPHSPDTSFPSDHATLAFAVTVALWRLDRRLGLASLALSLWLAVARVYIGAHYPSDVLGGALLGGLVAAAVLRFATIPAAARLLDGAFALARRLRLAAAPEGAPPPAAVRDVRVRHAG